MPLLHPVDQADTGLPMLVVRLLYAGTHDVRAVGMSTHSRHAQTAFNLQVLRPVGRATVGRAVLGARRRPPHLGQVHERIGAEALQAHKQAVGLH